MSNLYTWGYYTNSANGTPERHTIFAIAKSEKEAKEFIWNEYGKSLNWATINRALQERPASYSNGECFMCVTGASILP